MISLTDIAALAGKPEIGLGDALGSNVVNIALIFGLALLFGPIRAQRKLLGRNFFAGTERAAAHLVVGFRCRAITP